MDTRFALYLEAAESAVEEKKLEKALELLGRALECVKDARPPHPGRLDVYRQMLGIAADLEDEAAIGRILAEVVEWLRPVRGRDGYICAHYLQMLADYHKSREAPGEGLAPMREALAILERLDGAGASSVAALTNNLALLLKRAGRVEEALPLQQRSLELYIKLEGAKSVNAATLHHNLGETLKALGRLADAAEHHREALVIREDVEKPQPHEVIESQNSLATVLREMGEYADAHVLLERAEKASVKHLGAESLLTAIVRDNLAQVMQERGDVEGALDALTRVLPVYERELGPDHDDTRDVQDRIAAIRRHGGQAS